MILNVLNPLTVPAAIMFGGLFYANKSLPCLLAKPPSHHRRLGDFYSNGIRNTALHRSYNMAVLVCFLSSGLDNHE